MITLYLNYIFLFSMYWTLYGLFRAFCLLILCNQLFSALIYMCGTRRLYFDFFIFIFIYFCLYKNMYHIYFLGPSQTFANRLVVPNNCTRIVLAQFFVCLMSILIKGAEWERGRRFCWWVGGWRGGGGDILKFLIIKNIKKFIFILNFYYL